MFGPKEHAPGVAPAVGNAQRLRKSSKVQTVMSHQFTSADHGFARLNAYAMGTNAPGQIDLEIKDLEDRAAKLKTLLEGRPAKRPLIIEFSGSPKAGKTRCNSVLELFLKRNGIKVEVYTERASISPIKSKGTSTSMFGCLAPAFRECWNPCTRTSMSSFLTVAFLMLSSGTSGLRWQGRSHTRKPSRLGSSLR